ncbi:MAG: DUF3078 domain-containing protein [candidate division Zixibacteria bacterium]|nr:DUF3078 domain-containing protein [candidate division Zixibacteria bacterium]
MRTVLFLFFCLTIVALSVTSAAQDDTTNTGWNNSLVTDLTVTQASYSDSWVGGEAGSINWVWNLDGTAERQLSSKIDFKTTLRLKFGQTHTQNIVENPITGEIEKNWQKPKKSTDLIDWENVARFTLNGLVDPYAAFRLETQFFDGQVEAKKLYFSPLKLTESGGIARQFHKTETESIVSRLGLAVRQTIARSVIDTDLNTESTTVTDGGIESVSDATLMLSKRIQYVTKLTLYKAMFSSQSDDVALAGTEAEDFWKAVDVNFENTFSAAVSKVISVSLYTQILYDKETEKKARFKETLALGFVFRML